MKNEKVRRTPVLDFVCVPTACLFRQGSIGYLQEQNYYSSTNLIMHMPYITRVGNSCQGWL